MEWRSEEGNACPALSAYVIGVDAHGIEVEVDIAARGLPNFSIVGFPEAIRERVSMARDLQLTHFSNNKIFANGQMKTRHMKKCCVLTADAQGLLDTAMHRLGLSARAYSRILKVSRTIADLDAAETIDSRYIAEAIQYRTLDRGRG